MKMTKFILPIFSAVTMMFFFCNDTSAQNDGHYMRIAKIVVDSTKLESYTTALKEGMQAAVRIEPGVLSLYAVYDKKNPAHITIFEIYADENAYKFHVQTPHFKKYKSTVQDMVKSLELIDVAPIAFEAKKKE